MRKAFPIDREDFPYAMRITLTSVVFELLHFVIFVLLAYLVPIALFAYGAYAFYAEDQFLVSAAFLATACLFLFLLVSRRTRLSTKKVHYLKMNGRRLMSEFKSIDRRWNTAVNGESPVVVYTEYQGQTFQSEELWIENGSPFYINDASTRALESLQARDARSTYLIPVYVNPKRPSQYYMDLGELEVQSKP